MAVYPSLSKRGNQVILYHFKQESKARKIDDITGYRVEKMQYKINFESIIRNQIHIYMYITKVF